MNKTIVVKDANVLIDLEVMGLLDLWFQLDYTTLTTSFIVTELEIGNHYTCLAYVRTGSLRRVKFELDEMEEVEALYQQEQPHGISFADASVLYLAERENACLLSGDKALRALCAQRQLTFHGTFWIMERLIESGVLCPRVAASKLKYLFTLTGEQKRFLPQKQGHSLIIKWDSM
jgi:hypothetical protein